jgi:hypothetical protein
MIAKLKHSICIVLIAISLQSNAQMSLGDKTEEISIDSLMFHVDFFSSHNLMGRLPGTDGYRLAAEYGKNKFIEFGLFAFPDIHDYLQMVPVETNTISGPCKFHVIHHTKGLISFELGESYNFRGFTGRGEYVLPTVFCGYGLDEKGYNDYRDVDVRGKAVLVLRDSPRIQNMTFSGASLQKRAETAMKHGASAIIFIPSPDIERPRPHGSVLCGRGKDYGDFPMLQINYNVIETLLDGTGHTLLDIYNTINGTGKPHSFDLLSQVYIHVGGEYNGNAFAPNVVGYIPGNEKGYKDEWVLVTAHLDHVGFQCDVIYPGANDNASGSAAVIELARLFSSKKSKRGIIFALLTSEESGLQGAQSLADNLPIDHEQIVAVFNFDCIAVGDSIQIGNGLSNPLLYEVVRHLDADSLIIDSTWKGGGADLTPFTNLDIPGLYFVSKYSYVHLHLPSDTPETLNRALFKNIVSLGNKIIDQVANGYYCREEIVK